MIIYFTIPILLFTGCGGNSGGRFGRSTTKVVPVTDQAWSNQFEFNMKKIKDEGERIQTCDELSCHFDFNLPQFIKNKLDVILEYIQSAYSETGDFESDRLRYDFTLNFVRYHYDSEKNCANLFLTGLYKPPPHAAGSLVSDINFLDHVSQFIFYKNPDMKKKDSLHPIEAPYVQFSLSNCDSTRRYIGSAYYSRLSVADPSKTSTQSVIRFTRHDLPRLPAIPARSYSGYQEVQFSPPKHIEEVLGTLAAQISDINLSPIKNHRRFETLNDGDYSYQLIRVDFKESKANNCFIVSLVILSKLKHPFSAPQRGLGWLFDHGEEFHFPAIIDAKHFRVNHQQLDNILEPFLRFSFDMCSYQMTGYLRYIPSRN